MSANHSKGMIQSMIMIGGAQSIRVALSIFRMKMLALLLGPAGVGVMGIYNSLLLTSSNIAGLGLGSSGVREIAAVKGQEPALSRVRIVLLAANLAQGGLAMLIIWLLRAPLAHWLFGDQTRATQVGLVGVGVFLTLLGGSQTALLQGSRRVADLARVTVLGALAGTITGLTLVWLTGEQGLIWFLLAQPLTAVLVAWHYVGKLPKAEATRMKSSEIWLTWRPMVTLGMVFMLGGLATTATLLFVQRLIAHRFGLEGAGQFAASWGITMQYVGFLLAAMAADYYPRLTEIIDDRALATRLANDQIQLALALGGPILILLIGAAPWVMTILYSNEFTPASYMLRWQTIGNIFKLASWPLGFMLVAAARSRAYLFTELSWNIIFISLTWIGLPYFGINASGAAFLISYASYLLILSMLVYKFNNFTWSPLSKILIFIHTTLAVLALILSAFSEIYSVIFSFAASFASAIFGVRLVLSQIGVSGRLTKHLHRVYVAIGWPVEK